MLIFIKNSPANQYHYSDRQPEYDLRLLVTTHSFYR